MSLFKRKNTTEDKADTSKPDQEQIEAGQEVTAESPDTAKDNSTDTQAKAPGEPSRDEYKARRFFEHAQAMAETRNYDYAIELYIRGLSHSPDSLTQHQALHEVALKRKLAGGKPASFKEKMAFGLKTPLKKLLHAEMLWSKEPLSLARMLAVMEKAVEADAVEIQYNLGELAYWVGELILDKGQTDKPPTKDELIKIRDFYAAVEGWDKAAQACQLALQMAPDDPALQDSLREIQAEQMMATTRTDSTEGSIRDIEKQRELSMEDQIHKTESVLDELIGKRRVELEEDPEDEDKVVKLIEALIQKEDAPSSQEAITMLRALHEQTGQYRFKMRVGDVTIRQYARDLKALKEKIDHDKSDAELRKAYEKLYRERMAFELQEYTERVKNYPTDLGLKFELGRRLFTFKKYDEAIGMFQQAKSDPKFRAVCHEFLGRCFLAQDWLDEAIETLEEGKQHIGSNARLALELRWTLMEAYERIAQRDKSVEQAKKAYKLASEILQSNINFRDIKDHANKIRQMIKDLQSTTNPEPQA